VDTLRDFVSHLIAGGQNLILVNLSEVPFVDSSGVGEFVFALQTVEKAGGRLKLVNLQKWVEQRFRRVKLYDLFDVREDEAAALQSF
jgi:anti-sigma B factor antagonist